MDSFLLLFYFHDFSRMQFFSVFILVVCFIFGAGVVGAFISIMWEKHKIVVAKNKDSDSSRDNEKKDVEKSNKQEKNRRKGIGCIVLIVAFSFLLIIFVYFKVSEIYTIQDINEFDKKYVGQLVNNKPEGLGAIYDSENRIVYKGKFHNGGYDGKGELYIYNESNSEYVYYKGTFRKGKKNGYLEKYRVINGKDFKIFEGRFLNDIINGYGKEWDYSNSGNLKKRTFGFWENDNLNGFAQVIYFEGESINIRYTGNIINGNYNGIGIYEYIDSGKALCICGTFADNLANGECVLYDKYGMIIEQGYFKNGKCVRNYQIKNPIAYPDELLVDGRKMLFKTSSSVEQIEESELNWLDTDYTVWTNVFDFFEVIEDYVLISIFLIILFCVFFIVIIRYTCLYKKSKSKKEKDKIVKRIVLNLLCGLIISVVISIFVSNINHELNGNRFMGVLNEEQDGIGAVYDEEGYILRCGKFINGKLYGAGREYVYADNNGEKYIETIYEGTFIDGVLNGRVKESHYNYQGKLLKKYIESVSDGKKLICQTCE